MVNPFIPWAGGKRRLLKLITPHVPKSYGTYYEPFVGGGAMLFKLAPNKAVINDSITHLTTVYKIIKTAPELLLERLPYYKLNNSKEFFKETTLNINKAYKKETIRTTEEEIELAAMFMYLVNNVFCGLARFNKKGDFNMPFCGSKGLKYSRENILECSRILANTEILTGDYSNILSMIKEEDFVYLDPPYQAEDNRYHGIYIPGSYGRSFQEQVKLFCDELNKKKVKFILSNSNTELINQLYSSYTKIELPIKYSVGGNSESRRSTSELIIKNY